MFNKADVNNPKPQGWLLSPRAVRQFILGDDALGITPKFFGDDALVDRAIVTLLGKQGLMLVVNQVQQNQCSQSFLLPPSAVIQD